MISTVVLHAGIVHTGRSAIYWTELVMTAASTISKSLNVQVEKSIFHANIWIKLSVPNISSPEPNAQVCFYDHNLSVVVVVVVVVNFHIFIFSRTTRLISLKLGTKHPWVMGVQVRSNEGPHPFPRGNNYEIAKLYWQNIKIFWRTLWPILFNFCTNHPCLMCIQACSNEGPRPFPRGDDYELVKIHWYNLKIFFSRTTGLISTKLGTKHP